MSQPNICNVWKINHEICEALKINPSEALSVTIEIGAEGPIITVRYLLNNGKSDLLKEVLKRCVITDIKEC